MEETKIEIKRFLTEAQSEKRKVKSESAKRKRVLTTLIVLYRGAEFAGPENDGPKKDQRLENAGPGK